MPTWYMGSHEKYLLGTWGPMKNGNLVHGFPRKMSDERRLAYNITEDMKI